MQRISSKQKKTILALLIAVGVSIPFSWIVAILLTPVLWRLEPVLNMELAGHSGPADWVFWVIWAIVAAGFFFVLRLAFSTAKPN
jgi:TRAP-type mannitol/chloroaromatic compound transport system permease small subunit